MDTGPSKPFFAALESFISLSYISVREQLPLAGVESPEGTSAVPFFISHWPTMRLQRADSGPGIALYRFCYVRCCLMTLCRVPAGSKSIPPDTSEPAMRSSLSFLFFPQFFSPCLRWFQPPGQRMRLDSFGVDLQLSQALAGAKLH